MSPYLAAAECVTEHLVDGYINEHGTISLPRLQLLLDKLAEFEVKRFEDDLLDQVHFSGNHTRDTMVIEKARKKNRKGQSYR